MSSIQSLMHQLLDSIHATVTPQQVTSAVNGYLDSWTHSDAVARAHLFADDVIVEDPVGAAPVVGKAALIAFWQSAAGFPTRYTATLKHLVICGNEAFVEFTLAIDITGMAPATIAIREIFKLDASGKIISLRAFWDADSVS
jgi:steroid delta-isomerase